MTFKSHRDIQEAELKILNLIYLSEINVNILRESDLNEGFTSWLKDFGLNLKKSPDIMDYAVRFSSGIGMIIVAALKGDKHQIKAISNSYTKDELLDFLTKLDKLTLGLITAPLEAIEAVTGWDISGAVDKASKSTKKVLNNIKAAIISIKKDASKILDTPKQKVLLNHLDSIERTMPI